MANGIWFRKAALSRRKCRDGNPNDEGHGFRPLAGRTGLWLAPEEIPADIRLKVRPRQLRMQPLPHHLVDADPAAAQRGQDEPEISGQTLRSDILRIDFRETG